MVPAVVPLAIEAADSSFAPGRRARPSPLHRSWVVLGSIGASGVQDRRETARQIVLYSVVMVAFTMVVGLWLGPLYTVAAVVLGVIFMALAVLLRRDLTRGHAKLLFHYSLLYLALLFAAAALDPVLL